MGQARWASRARAAAIAPTSLNRALARATNVAVHTIPIIGAIEASQVEPETRPAMQIKFGEGHGWTTLPLVIIRLSRNCFYVLNGKARYLFRVCEKTFL